MTKIIIPEGCRDCEQFDGKIGCNQTRDFLICIKECPKDGHPIVIEGEKKTHEVVDVDVHPVGHIGRITMGAWQYP